MNEIHFSPAGNRNAAASFTTTYEHASVAPVDRAERFHNSETEKNCSTCHEGLPSADGGATMTADCNICHKEHQLADYIHGPVEMKECGTCHSWSAEKKALIVEAGVPGVCVTCHDDKQAAMDSSAYPHPVVSECTTCHTPHSSDRKHLLKDDVNKLCAGCHEGFDINHPVGRHPVRFAVNQATGEEISCVSCHKPHGSEFPKLLIAGNSTSEICSQCH
jgi:predicted CXXCH cytochrome family protein